MQTLYKIILQVPLDSARVVRCMPFFLKVVVLPRSSLGPRFMAFKRYHVRGRGVLARFALLFLLSCKVWFPSS